ncbi:MAG: hypothetical protein R6V84_10605 [Desulfobacterales bacterium]
MKAIGAGLLAALFVWAGCASSFDYRRQEQFAERAHQYGKLIRWSEFELARSYLSNDAQGRRAPLPKEVRVVDYEVKQLIVAEDARKAGQTVEITYFKERDPRVRTLTDTQQWEFDPERSDWFLKNGFPDFN